MKKITVGLLLNNAKQSLKVKDINKILGIDILNKEYSYDRVLELTEEQFNKLGLTKYDNY